MEAGVSSFVTTIIVREVLISASICWDQMLLVATWLVKDMIEKFWFQ